MKKHLELSDRACNVPGCEKKIKARLVEARLPHNSARCFKHYTQARRSLNADTKNKEAITAPITMKRSDD